MKTSVSISTVDVFNVLGGFVESLLLPIMARFVEEGSNFAAGLAGLLVFAALVGIVVLGLLNILPTWLALLMRSKAVSRALKDAEDFDGKRHLFAEKFVGEIEPAMDRGFASPLSKFARSFGRWFGPEIELRLAWSEFKETFVDENANPIRNTQRPEGYIRRAIKNPNQWAGVAGLFVSLGLLATFIGIIAVLLSASCALNSQICVVDSSSPYASAFGVLDENAAAESASGYAGTGVGAQTDNNERAIIGIVSGAASKFYASIGGLAASILFRVAVSLYSALIRARVDKLSDVLEMGLAYAPEQQTMRDQLSELKEQTVQLKTFNTDLAVTLGDRIDAAIAPVASGIGDLRHSIEQNNERTMQVLGQGVGDAVNNIAGGEIRELGRVLGSLREELGGLSGRLSEGGDEAANKLAEVADQIKKVGEGLQSDFDAVTARMQQASQKQSDEVANASKELTDKIAEMVNGIGESLTGSVGKLNEAGSKNADSMNALAGKLETLASQVEQDGREAMTKAFGEAAKQTTEAATDAAGKMREAYEAASETWRETINDSVLEMKRLSEGFEAAQRAISQHATTIERAASSTDEAAGAITSAGEGLKSSTAPLMRLVEGSRQASENIERAATQFSEQANSALHSAQTLATAMAETSKAAEEAWSEYAERFDDVDDELAGALNTLQDAFQQSASRMAEYVSNVDGQLANAVTQLAGVIEPLTEFSDQMDDLLVKLEKQYSDRND